MEINGESHKKRHSFQRKSSPRRISTDNANPGQTSKGKTIDSIPQFS